MSEDIFTKDFKTPAEMGWAELDDIVEQATEIIQMDSKILCGREKIQQMIEAIKERRKDLLWNLANGDGFPFQKDVLNALQLLI